MAAPRGALQRGRPNVAAVVVGGLSPSIIKRTISSGADAVELRIDAFKDIRVEYLVATVRDLGRVKPRLPVILTVRSMVEGGKRDLTDARRLEIFKALMPYADIVDVELSSSAIIKEVVRSAAEHSKKVMVSYHNFKSTPSIKTLGGIVKRAEKAGADIVKIAAFARSVKDVAALAGLLAGSDDLVVIAMGDCGRASRVFFPMMGSLVTYGSVTGSTAPGQFTLKEIKKEFARYGF